MKNHNSTNPQQFLSKPKFGNVETFQFEYQGELRKHNCTKSSEGFFVYCTRRRLGSAQCSSCKERPPPPAPTMSTPAQSFLAACASETWASQSRDCLQCQGVLKSLCLPSQSQVYVILESNRELNTVESNGFQFSQMTCNKTVNDHHKLSSQYVQYI